MRTLPRSLTATSVAGLVLLGPLTSPVGRDRSRPVAEVPSPAPDGRAIEVQVRVEPERKRPHRVGPGIGVRTSKAAFRVFERPMWKAPHRRLAAHNPIAQRLVLGVDRKAGSARWLRVLLPERPNGSTGWVNARSVRMVRLRERITVDLSKRTLRHFRDGRLVHRFVVGVGTASTPTPRGRFDVWARVDQPGSAGPYGVFALGLSGFSPVLTDWPGGGRSAIHGTADPSDRGRRVSHGCVRVFNEDMKALVGVPMGTPVVITR